MSEARSLTPLSEADYDAIAGAVMETARGRWFMSEFAKRNRQADTLQLLNAIGRIERVVGIGAQPAESRPELGEAAALIADLRLDLERISGRASEPSSGLAARIETAATAISTATEHVQEAAWSLREAGADEALCDHLDRRSAEICAATVTVEATAHQIGKIADTIAMLDSSLRAFCESAGEAASPAAAPATAAPPSFAPPSAASLRGYEDIEVVEIGDEPAAIADEPRLVALLPPVEPKPSANALIGDDIVFEEIAEEAAAVPGPATSETDLREIDAFAAEKKLAYFA
jgi:hypothetical protein